MRELEYRFATQEDAALLAEMNQQLIRDEGHRNRRSCFYGIKAGLNYG